MSDHLRYSGISDDRQRAALEEIVRASPALMAILVAVADLALPDGLLTSGAIYNTVWNSLTGRPALTGINDADVAYFDSTDLSYEAEDAVIQRVANRLVDTQIPVQVRNQARVHLWFPQKFGLPYPPLRSSAEMLERFATRTHAIGVRLQPDGRLAIMAPFGLDDMFSFRLAPNTVLDNAKTHMTKAARAKSVWPELTIVPWP